MAASEQDRAPGDLQLRVLEALWDGGELTAADVQEALSQRRRLALTTISTVLQRMDKAGLVTHRSEGRQHIYRAKVTRDRLRTSGVRSLLRRFFDGDPAALVSHLVDAEGLGSEDLTRVKQLLRRHRSKS
jgi:predicted transcriptional regulator